MQAVIIIDYRYPYLLANVPQLNTRTTCHNTYSHGQLLRFALHSATLGSSEIADDIYIKNVPIAQGIAVYHNTMDHQFRGWMHKEAGGPSASLISSLYHYCLSVDAVCLVLLRYYLDEIVSMFGYFTADPWVTLKLRFRWRQSRSGIWTKRRYMPAGWTGECLTSCKEPLSFSGRRTCALPHSLSLIVCGRLMTWHLRAAESPFSALQQVIPSLPYCSTPPS
jgi:hypothetical protein